MSKQKHPVDDLFRRELADYTVTPAQERRAEFMRDAGNEINKRHWRRLWIVGMITGLLIIGGVITGVLLTNEKDHTVNKDENVKVNNDLNGTSKETVRPAQYNAKLKSSNEQPVRPSAPSSKTNINTIKNEKTYNGNKIAYTKSEGTKSSKITEPTKAVKPATVQPGKPILPAAVTAQEKTTNIAEAVTAKTEAQAKTENISTPAPAGQPVQKTEAKQPSEKITGTEGQPEEKKKAHKEKDPLPKQWNIDVGVYYSPEWMFNTLNGDKFVNNAGVEGTFHFGPYSVRTGVGLSLTVGYNEILVKSNPYLGTYKSLDSIAFTWDDNYNLVPSYYTTNKEVFDTALQYNYSNYKKRYTYLQVPLILGYDFWQNRLFSLGIRGGAVMSVLLNTETLSGSYDPGRDKIVAINNVTPDRIQLNWQAVAGMSASFRLTRRFSVEVEPDLRYYFNSVYQSSDLTKKIWSVGIRSALIVTF